MTAQQDVGSPQESFVSRHVLLLDPVIRVIRCAERQQSLHLKHTQNEFCGGCGRHDYSP
jgi:hypothetical protein